MTGALRDLRRLWAERKQSAVVGGGGGVGGGSESDPEAPRPSLPLLQVWPSQDSPRSTDGQPAFVFPPLEEDGPSQHNDSGIDSVQASPCGGPGGPGHCLPSPSSLLHPDRARTLVRRPSSPEQNSLDEPDPPLSPGSSTGSSLASVRHLDWERRRSSTLTTRMSVGGRRYSLLDALDLEYALFRAAARGSVGPYSLTGSVHKLTFTQSLAFPALARGLAASKRHHRRRTSAPSPLDRNGLGGDSGLNAFAKIVTALVLMLVSVMVFGVVYKFVRT